MIACLEFRHTITDAFHKPSTVRHGDTAIGYTIGRAHNSVVMEVERTCMQSYPDRSRPGCPRIGQFDTFNPVKAAWRSDDDGLQVGLQFKRLRRTAIGDRWNCRPVSSLADAGSRHAAKTRQPSPRYCRANSKPSPRLAPVISATGIDSL